MGRISRFIKRNDEEYQILGNFIHPCSQKNITEGLELLQELVEGKEASAKVKLSEEEKDMLEGFLQLVSQVEGCKPAVASGGVTVYTGVINNTLTNIVVQAQQDLPVLIGINSRLLSPAETKLSTHEKGRRQRK